MNSKKRQLSHSLIAVATAGLILSVAGCPKPKPKPKPKPRARPVMSFPWRLWSRRVEGQLHVVKATKRRIVAVEYGELPKGGLKPIAVVGLEAGNGQERWRRKLNLKLLHPKKPWSVQVALKNRVLALWLEDDSLLGIDILTGRNFWKKPRPKSLGVKAVGFGFVTAWKKKVYFLKPTTGKVMNSFDLPEAISAPLTISAESEAIMPCGSKVVGLNLNSGKVVWSHDMDLKNGKLPANMPRISEERVVLAHDTVNTIVTTHIMRLEGKSLRPKWNEKLKGRVRTHKALWLDSDEYQFLFAHRGGKQLWHRLNPADGKPKGTLPGRPRIHCVPGKDLLYCPFKRKGVNGIEAMDPKTMKVSWAWETVGDRSKNEHKYINGVFYVADGKKVLGLDVSGKTVFKARILFPGLNLQANRILGVHKGVLVVTVVDWGEIGKAGKGEIWGIDLKTSRRRWRKRLPGTLYTTDAVKMRKGFVYYMDHRKVHLLRANSGYARDGWFHKMPGKPAAPPHMELKGDLLYAKRGQKLVVFNPKNTRPMWRTDLKPGSRIAGYEMDLLFVRSLDKQIHAHNAKNGKKLWSKPWAEPADPKFLDLTGSVKKGLLLAGRNKSLIVDPKTGEKKGDWSGVRHIRRLKGGDLLILQVNRRVPKAKNEFVVMGIRRKADEVKLVELWRLALPRIKGDTPQAVDKGGFDWWKVTSSHLLYKDKESGCLKVVSMDDGKETWKNCEAEWPAPPLHYKGFLYAGSGGFRPTKGADQQGLLKLDIDTGKVEKLLKIPGPSSTPNRFMVNSPMRIKAGVLYVLTHGPRLRAIKVTK